jgi:hypothetical protein
MTPSTSCPHESEVLDLAALGHWPQRADAALRTHAAGCPVCADLARVATLLANWQDGTLPHVHVPDASRVWREATQRARADAARRATQPVRAVELAALAAAVLLLVAWGPALGGLTGISAGSGRWLSGVWDTVLNAPSAIAIGWASLRLPATLHSSLQWGLLTLAAWAVVVPIAFSLAGLADRTSRHENGHSKPAR